MILGLPMRKTRAAFVVEYEDDNGEVKRMIYGFDPYRPVTITEEPEYDRIGFFSGTVLDDYAIHLTIEGYAGNPMTYNGPMPTADQQEIPQTREITDGSEDIIEGELID